MHEISLIRNTFRTIEDEFSAEEVASITAIDLKVGLLSNIEPLLMQNAFDAVTAAENKFQSVQLNIETVPIEIYCDSCDKNSTIENYKFACAHCGTPNNNVVKGTELLISKVHFG